METNHTSPPTPHVQTRAEIKTQIKALSKTRRDLSVEAADLYAGRMKSGSAPKPALSPHAMAVRDHIHHLLNGSTPPEMLLPLAPSREEQIQIQVQALDYVLRTLARRDEEAGEQEAQDWVDQHKDEWKALCREIILTAIKLHALEEKSRTMLYEGARGHFVNGLVMLAHVGRGESILGVGEPLKEILADALKQHVVTQAQIRKAEDVG